MAALDSQREPLDESGDKSTSQGDGTVEDPGEQNPQESGTTSLGGESRDSADDTGPGGIEGDDVKPTGLTPA